MRWVTLSGMAKFTSRAAVAELFEQANQARRDRLAAMLACSKQRGGFRADQ